MVCKAGGCKFHIYTGILGFHSILNVCTQRLFRMRAQHTNIAILSEMSKVNILHPNLSEMVRTRTIKMICYYEMIVLHCSVVEMFLQPGFQLTGNQKCLFSDKVNHVCKNIQNGKEPEYGCNYHQVVKIGCGLQF